VFYLFLNETCFVFFLNFLVLRNFSTFLCILCRINIYQSHDKMLISVQLNIKIIVFFPYNHYFVAMELGLHLLTPYADIRSAYGCIDFSVFLFYSLRF